MEVRKIKEDEARLISLIQCIYDGSRPMPSLDHADALLEDIELFELYPQLYSLLKQNGRLNELPPHFRLKLEAGWQRTLGQSMFIKHKENELTALFEKQQIDVIVLKGARFAEHYYGHYTARTSSDIDLLVRKSRFDQAIAALQREGYLHEMTVDHHARIVKNRFLVELHWTLDIPVWSDLHEDAWWQSADRIGRCRHVQELSPLHTLYFICLHGARHQMSSVRYLLDVVQVLTAHPQQIDLAALMEMARTDRTARRIQAVLSIVYSQFPFLHELKSLPFPMLQIPWTYEIVRRGCLGEKSSSYYRYKLYFRHFMFDTWKHRFHSIKKPY